jgi:hemerythrin superfamily protein
MGSIINWNGKLNVPKALQRDHDDARAEFVRATTEGGRIAKAGRRVAQLCLPHFEHEEKKVFPVLALLPYLAPENLQPEMMDVMPLISELRAKHDAIADHHQEILAAIDELMLAARKQNNREFAEFAHNLKNHEDIETELIYPTVLLIGNYLQDRFAN